MTFCSRNIAILCGKNHHALCNHASKSLGAFVESFVAERFSDGESFARVPEKVHSMDLFLIQSTCPPVNDHLMDLMVTVDAAKRLFPQRITGIIPYYGYSRQDRVTEKGSPLSACLVANLLETSGLDQVIFVDLHTPKIQDFFNIPAHNMSPVSLFAQDIRASIQDPSTILCIAPDEGALSRTQMLAETLNASYATVEKTRDKPGSIQSVTLTSSNPENRHCIIVDDIVDSGKTLCAVAKLLKEKKATSVSAYSTHGLFSHPQAFKILDESDLDEIVVTDSIPLPMSGHSYKKVRQITLAPLLMSAIDRYALSPKTS